MAMIRTKTLLVASSVAVLLSGCEDIETTLPGYLATYGEAGTPRYNENYGTSTANNIAVQTGQKSYVISLAERFAERVPDTVNFAFNSAQLDAEARTALDQQADFMRQFPEVRFRVYGHTDLVGSTAYNKSLGMRRAQAVVSYLATKGVPRSRLEAVVSYGETRPLINTEDRERRNRRTVTEVSGFVQDHPLVLNGKYAEVIWREYVASATQMPQGTSAAGLGGE